MAFVEYITQPNDRWDLIAHKHYGAVRLQSAIIDANRHLFASRPMQPLPAILPAGITLRIPVLDEQPDDSLLPPWKRGRGQPVTGR